MNALKLEDTETKSQRTKLGCQMRAKLIRIYIIIIIISIAYFYQQWF